MQEPRDPSGLMRPMPVFGQVAGSSLPSARTRTSAPWHCKQPLTAAAEGSTRFPSSSYRANPSTTSASTLSRLPRIWPPLEWWLASNSAVSCWWQLAQSSGETMVAIQLPSWL